MQADYLKCIYDSMCMGENWMCYGIAHSSMKMNGTTLKEPEEWTICQNKWERLTSYGHILKFADSVRYRLHICAFSFFIEYLGPQFLLKS